jgi:hypothetical protein
LGWIAAHDEGARRDFDETEQWIIEKIPRIPAEARITEPSQGIAGSDALSCA